MREFKRIEDNDGCALVERFHETDHMGAWSFRGATEGGEPGIHSLRPVVMDSALSASRRAPESPRKMFFSKTPHSAAPYREPSCRMAMLCMPWSPYRRTG